MSELHPSHTVDHYVNAEYEFVCVKCGNVDTYGQGWGALADPCPADHTVSDTARDEVARVVTQVAEEGLPHPRNLDAALDVIFESVKSKHRKDCETLAEMLSEILKALVDQDEERIAWAIQRAEDALGDL